MVWQYNPFVWLPLGVMLTAAGLAISSWRERGRRLASHRLGMMAASLTVIWALAYVMQLSSGNLQAAYFWLAVQMIGPLSLPLFWLIVAYQLCLPKATHGSGAIALLAIIPCASAVLLFVPGLGGPLSAAANMTLEDGVQVLHVTPGPFYRIQLAHSYALITITIGLLAVHARNLAPYSKRQAQWMLAAVGLMLAANLIFASGWLAWQKFQPATLAAMIAQLLFLWGVISTPLIDIRPIARERVVEAMRDGLLVLDLERRLVDVSPSAATMLGVLAKDLLGNTAEYALARWPKLAAICQEQGLAVVEIEHLSDNAESIRWIEARTQPLYDQSSHQLGCIVLLRDITEHKLVDQAQEHLIAELQRALAEVKTLQGLLPVCAWCGKIRDDEGTWSPLDDYVTSHYDATVTHGICPDCAERFDQANEALYKGTIATPRD